VQSYVGTVLRTYTSQKIALGLRARIFPHVQRLSLSFHDERGTSDTIYRILYDTTVVPAVLIDGIIPLVTAVVTLAAMGWIVVTLSPPLAAIALVIAPVLFLISRPFGRRLREQWHALKEFESSALKVLQEVLTSLRVVKAFGREEAEKDRLMDVATRGMKSQVEIVSTKAKFDVMVGLITAAGTATVLFKGMLLVKGGDLTLGELLMVVAYLAYLYGPISTIVGQIANLQSSLASAERALELLDTMSEVTERPNARPIARAAGSIQFRDVAFSYDGERPVLQQVSFSASAGARVGVVGPTGAGKTTLVNMMTRLYDPTAGEVRLDDVDLRDYKLADLRAQFSIVIQEPVLFSRTIEENIAYAKPGATREQIIDAARLAHAHEFIMGLPDGYRTLVGERGMRLSGGERQRVSLARAFLKDAPILILDEPTSSVDMKTEALIMEALTRLMRGRTTFIIAHRTSTLRDCDIVLVIEAGRARTVAKPESDRDFEALALGGFRAEEARAVS
jgi:ATP-binding cassette subfamily B protein